MRPTVVVVGIGKMGLLHGGLIQASGQADVVGLVDRSRQGRLIAKGMGVRAPTFATLERAIAKTGASGALICTPPSTHFQLASTAIRSGLHVFVEKPLTISPAQSHQLADLARARKVSGTVGYMKRHHAVFQRLRFLLAHETPRRIGVRFRSPQFAGAAQGASAKRGGVEWDLLPHAADAAIWLTSAIGGDIRLVSATRANGGAAFEILGRRGAVEIIVGADSAADDIRKPELSAHVELADGSQLLCTEDLITRIRGDTREKAFHWADAPAPWFEIAGGEYSEQMLDVIRSFRGEQATGASLSEAAMADDLVDAAIRSLEVAP